MKSVLVVEDEAKIARVLQDYLEAAGCRVTVVSRGDQVLGRIQKNPPDLVLLDLMLPGMDGIEVCREIRKSSNLPVIMVTAKAEEIDRLLGLELGADDYICKPFSPREVVARVRAVLRRAHPEPDTQRVTAGPIELDVDSLQVSVGQTLLDLTYTEFKLLQVLMAAPGKVFSRNELIQRVQGYDFDGYDRTIDSHIKNLRKKIAAALPDSDVITTVYGVGYKFLVPPA